jgi:hypothetical protein
MNQNECRNNLPIPIGSPTLPSEPIGDKTRITSVALKSAKSLVCVSKWKNIEESVRGY